MWEYKIIQTRGLSAFGLEQECNHYGKDGWELVNAVPGENNGVKLFFKRRKER